VAGPAHCWITTSQSRDKRTRTGNFPTSVLHFLLTANSTNVSKSLCFCRFAPTEEHGKGWHTDCLKLCGRSAARVASTRRTEP